MLREELRRRLLEDRGIHVTEACDKCGQLLGSVRYTRRGELGEYCSGECRGDGERVEIRKGGRPRKYRTAEQAHVAKMGLQRIRRNGPNDAKTPCSLLQTKGLQTRKSPLSHDPLPAQSQARCAVTGRDVILLFRPRAEG